MKSYFYILCLIPLFIYSLRSQEESTNNQLYIFGSIQPVFFVQNFERWLENNETEEKFNQTEENRNSFAVQQLDLYMSKLFYDKFQVFLDLNFKLNYSSEKKWGSLELEEAWIKYSPAQTFNFKVGLLLPNFNNLNNIKTKLATLPYAFRPVIYEQILNKIITIEDFIPERAFVEVNSYLPLGYKGLGVDISGYVGNSESSYISTTETDKDKRHPNDSTAFDFLSGVDTKDFNFKLIGGRIGLRKANGGFKCGFSATYDTDNRTDSVRSFDRTIPALGNVPRIRLGADLSFSLCNFDFEAEIIDVLYHSYYPVDPSVEMGQKFVYGNLLYNFFEDYYVYFGAHYLEDKLYQLKNYNWNIGGGWKVNNYLTAKIQYVNYREETKLQRKEDTHYGLINFFIVGASVLF